MNLKCKHFGCFRGVWTTDLCARRSARRGCLVKLTASHAELVQTQLKGAKISAFQVHLGTQNYFAYFSWFSIPYLIYSRLRSLFLPFQLSIFKLHLLVVHPSPTPFHYVTRINKCLIPRYSLYLSLTLPLSICLCLCFSQILHFAHSISVYLFFHICLCICLFVHLFVHNWLSLSICLGLFLYSFVRSCFVGLFAYKYVYVLCMSISRSIFHSVVYLSTVCLSVSVFQSMSVALCLSVSVCLSASVCLL